MTDQPKRPRTLYKRTGRRPKVGTAVIVSELPPLHSRAVFEPDGPEALIGLLAVGYPEAPGHPIGLDEAARATGYRLKAARALMKSPAFAAALAEARKRHQPPASAAVAPGRRLRALGPKPAMPDSNPTGRPRRTQGKGKNAEAAGESSN